MPKLLLDVSAGVYAEVRARFNVTDLVWRIQEHEGREILNMGDIFLRSETDEEVKVWLLYEGKKIL